MEIGEDLININVTICDRPYRLKVKPEEEENVRKAAKQINDRIKELQQQYAAKDKQDYLAMVALMNSTEKINGDQRLVVGDEDLSDRLSEIDKRLDQILEL